MNTKPFVSIRVKVLILLFFCILVPFLFYWFYSYHYIRSSLDEEFVSQTTSSMTAAGSSISDYIRLADSAARGLYFNSELMDLLSEDNDAPSDYRLLYTESRIFDFLQTLYSSVPEASQIHLSAFHLKKSLLLQADMQRYEKDHIYLNEERIFPCEPYHSYVTAAHMQSDYNFLNLADREFTPVFTVHMPIYDIPSTSKALGEISIDIPLSALEGICRPVYQDQETLCIIDGDGNYVYNSRGGDIAAKVTDPAYLEILQTAREATGAHLMASGSDDIIIYNRISVEPYDWYLIKVSPKSFVYAKADHFFNLMLYSFIGVTAAEILFILIAVLHLTSPLRKATSYAEAVTAGDLNARMSDYITYEHNDEIGSLLIAIRKMIHSIRHFTIRQYQLELANRTSELKALQAQINPHFIHNTLQCLATNALENGNVPLYHSITALGQMMHYSMNTRQVLVPLEDALRYIELYLQLQKMRFPSSLVSDFQITDEAKKLLIPKMTLQPLVENSIRHGNLLQLEDSRLTIRAYLEDPIFHIWVEDTGTGMRLERISEINAALREVRASVDASDAPSFLSTLNQMPDDPENSASDQQIRQAKEQRFVSSSIGVRNVYQRLLLYFKNQCSMEFLSNSVCGTTVHIQLDYRMLDTDDTKKRDDR